MKFVRVGSRIPAPGARRSRRRSARFWFFDRTPHLQSHRQAGRAGQEDGYRGLRPSVSRSVPSRASMPSSRSSTANIPYNLWRPVTAIRNADLTSNAGDAARGVLAAARRYPDASEYPCAHCIVAAADFHGSANGRRRRGRCEITLTSRLLPASRANGRACRTTATRFRTPAFTPASTTASPPRSERDMGKKIGQLTVQHSCAAAVASAQPKP